MKKKGKSSYPYKTSINLVMKEDDRPNYKLFFGAFSIFLAAMSLFGKFAVIDRINLANAQIAENQQAREQIDSLIKSNSDYDEILSKYSHYSIDYQTADEKAEWDRIEILSLIERDVMRKASIQSIDISGKTVSLTINETTLSIVSNIVSALEADAMTDYVAVSTATTAQSKTDTEEGKNMVSANITIELVDRGEQK